MGLGRQVSSGGEKAGCERWNGFHYPFHTCVGSELKYIKQWSGLITRDIGNFGRFRINKGLQGA